MANFHYAICQNPLLEKARQFAVLDSSIFYGEKQLEVSVANNDTNSIIETSQFLALGYINKAQYAKAKKIINTTLPLTIFKKDKSSEALCYLLIANKNKAEKNELVAIEFYLKAYDMLEKIQDWKNLLRCDVDIAEYYRKIGKFKDAKIFINRAFELYHDKKIENIPQLIRINNRAAAIENESSHHDSSIYYSRIALTLSRQINDKNLEAVSLNEIGFSFKNLGKLDTALNCYKKAENLWISMGYDGEAVNAMANRAMLYSHNFYPKREVLNMCFQIIDLVERKKIDYSLTQIYLEVQSQFLFLGDTINAYRYFRKFHTSELDDIERSQKKEVDNIKEKYENDKIRKQVQLVSGELTESQAVLKQKKHEIFIVYIFISILILLIIFIVFLVYKLNNLNKNLRVKNKLKDALIQEIHHRVKNNLQFVSSLINMQINASLNKDEVYSLNDASRRIRAMSLVHEMLYNHAEINGVFIKQYLNELLELIIELVNLDSIPIEFDLQVDEMIFDTSKSIALGMITSELVSNAIKYAFLNHKNPKISISLIHLSGQNQIQFILKDNGPGFIETNDKRKKMGMRLISIFSRQLKGDFKFESEMGLKYTLVFKLN